MNSVRKNIIYNTLYQILMLFIPLITVPYVSRIIGAEGIGLYSYNYSIVNYFMLITLLGINNYGNRSIAKVRDNKEKLSKTFTSIYAIQLIMGMLMLIIYILYVLYNQKYIEIALVQSIFVISSIFDINWFFFGIEKFKLTVTRNMVIKMVSLILIFTLVNKKDDLQVYTLIMSSSVLISQLLLWPFLRQYINFSSIKITDIIQHIRPCVILFIPVIAVSLYKIMDKIMLGSLSNLADVGYYESAEKIINIPMSIITALGTVMLPKMSNMIANGEVEKGKLYIEKSLELVMFLAFPICFGIIAISNSFVPLFLGNDFTKSIILVIYLSFTIIFISWANVIRTQYLIPLERDKEYIISVFLGAFINFIMNIIFIPQYGSIGACFGTLAAEFTVMMYQTVTVRKELCIKKYLKNTKPFAKNALIMFMMVIGCYFTGISSVYLVFVQVLVGIITYGLLNIKYITEVTGLKVLVRKSRCRY